MKKSTLVLVFCTFTFGIMTRTTHATTNIHVIKENGHVKSFDMNGNVVNQGDLKKIANSNGPAYLLYENYFSGETWNKKYADVHEHEGHEIIILHRGSKNVTIKAPGGEILDKFQARKSTGYQGMAVGIGELDDSNTESEIVVCHELKYTPRIKIFGYDGETATKITVFDILPDETGLRGCQYLVIADVDGDSENEIIASTWNRKNLKYQIIAYAKDGTVKYALESTKYPAFNYIDANEDGAEDLINKNEKKEKINIFDLPREDNLADFDAVYPFILVKDLDGDSKAEIISYGEGRKGAVNIYSVEIESEPLLLSSFKALPNRKSKNKYMVYVGDDINNVLE